jgi:hypothetical protein
MRYGAVMVLLLGIAAGAVIGTGDGPSASNLAGTALAGDPAAAKPAEKTAGPPPLKVDRSAPLLLDEPSKTAPKKKPAGPVADNGACLVCHTNYEHEEMVVQHADGNVGCIKCHGESLAHRNDEDNVTPPDVMYPASKIEKGCKECHDSHDVPARDVIARWQKKCPAKTDPSQLVCTDCHGDHRLKLRTVRWDKETRKLLTRSPAQPKPKNDATK